MRPIEQRIPAADGYVLAATVHRPEGPANGMAVQINGATGVPRGYYNSFAGYLAGRGFAVVHYDYRGIGGSRGGTADRRRMRMAHWGTLDAPGIAAWAATHLSERLAVIGHSAGGQMIGLMPNNHLFQAGIGIAAQSAYWRHWPAGRRWVMWGRWHLQIPAIAHAFGGIPSRISGFEDLPKGIALEWARWGRHPAYFVDPRGRPIQGHFDRFARPLRLIGFPDDEYAPPGAVDALATFYRNARIEREEISPADWPGGRIGHFGFFRRSAPERHWAALAFWLATRLGDGRMSAVA